MSYEFGLSGQEMVRDWFRHELPIIERLAPDRGSTIVDLGCGTNIFVKALQDKGYESVIGIDLDEDLATTNRGAIGSESMMIGVLTC